MLPHSRWLQLTLQRMSDGVCRPLSRAQQTYAQRDAHYLLYLAHVLYQELEAQDALGVSQKDKSRVMQAWERCQRVSLSLYNKPRSHVSPSPLDAVFTNLTVSCAIWICGAAISHSDSCSPGFMISPLRRCAWHSLLSILQCSNLTYATWCTDH